MQSLLLFGFLLSFLLCRNSVSGQSLSDNRVNNPADDEVTGNTINIMTSPDLNHLTADWISEYEKLNSGVRFAVSTFNGSQIDKTGDMIFITTDRITDSFNWKISLGRNVIVAVMNAKNPMFKEILAQGLSVSEFSSIYSGSGKINWSDLIKNGQNKPVNQYIIDNAGIKTGVSDFIQNEPVALNAHLIENASEFIAAIQEDPYAVGFCRLSDIRREGPDGLIENIRLLPIDKNGNGRMDNFENIYNSPDDLARGVWIGKYPHTLSGSIYAMSQSVPTDKNAIAFLSWIMTDGGKHLLSNGYGDLIGLEKQANLALLSGNKVNEVTTSSPASLSWLLILVLAIVATLIVIAFIFLFTSSGFRATDKDYFPVPALNDKAVSIPEGLYFDKTHTWTFMERDGLVRLGIDDFLQHVTGTITRITMKDAGEYVRRGEKILTLIKFGKQLSLYSPVSGTIRVRNLKLDENSSLVNTSPYAEGWVYLIEPKNWLRELQFMWMGEKYRDWLKDEFTRLRNFFEGTLKTPHANFEYLILQDGGELRDNLLADLGPEIWEEFQRKFIDPSR